MRKGRSIMRKVRTIKPDVDFMLPLRKHPKRYDPYLQKREGKPVYTPYIMLNHDDPLAPTGVFWLSPDIWVVSSLGKNLPVEGEANRIFARVHNRGLMDAANVNVTFYWADPSAAITDATVNPVGGSKAAATAQGVFIQSVLQPGGDSVVTVACPSPWFPIHLAHECLVVKAWCPGRDPNAAPWEPMLDPVYDRHSAQHNVTVKLLPPGQEFMIPISVANISGFTQMVRVQVTLWPFEQVAMRLKRLDVPLKVDLIKTERLLPMKAAFGEKRSLVHEGDAVFGRALLREDLAPRDSSRLAAREVLLAELRDEFAPWERRTVDLAGFVPREARPGEAYGFSLTQFLGEIRLGGYSGLVVVAKR